MRAEFPRSPDELRKAISSILLSTTSPVVTFDNIRDTLRSGLFESLLTEADWGDRILGGHDHPPMHNDRLWMLTGNGMTLGGDMHRRAIEVYLDCPDPRPQDRTDFRIDLPGWAVQRRPRIVWALLVFARHWVREGMPYGKPSRADSFGKYVAGIRGVLGAAGFDEGTFDDPATRSADGSLDDEDLAMFLVALAGRFGDAPFSVALLVDALTNGGLKSEQLPSELAAKWDLRRHVDGETSTGGFSKSCGNYLRRHDRRFAGGWKAERTANPGGKASYRVRGPR